MTRVRIIKERYDEFDNVEKDPRTNEAKVNGGAYRRYDPEVGRVRDFFPGEVMDLPEPMALAEIRNAPRTLELESTHLARLARIAARRESLDPQRDEFAARVQMLEAAELQAQKFKAMQQERERELAAANIRAAESAKEKATIETLMRKMEADQLEQREREAKKDAQLAELMAKFEALSRPPAEPKPEPAPEPPKDADLKPEAPKTEERGRRGK